MPKRYFYIFFVLCSLVAAQSQQKNNEIKMKLAQSYERSRDYENAVKLYEELYASDTSNFSLFEALKRTYLQSKKYPEAISLINRRLKLTPHDLSLMSQLGTVYVRNGNEAAAQAVWERAILLDSTSEISYSLIAGAMTESRLFDRAVELLKRGRNACNNQSLFVSELASLYSNTMNYADATREYIKLVHENAVQLGFIESRMSSYVKRDDGLKAATEVVEQSVKPDPDNLALLQLLAWLYMEGKRYDSAFDVYKKIDGRTNAGGREIFLFAERAFRDKVYSVASQAYREVVQSYPKIQMVPQAKFGYARTLEELSSTKDTMHLFGEVDPFRKPAEQETQAGKPATESELQFTGVVSAYKGIVADYPKTEIAARSLLRIASLMYERFFNLDEAQATLDDLVKNYTQFIPLIAEGKFLLGDVALAQGDLERAEGIFKSLNDLRPVPQELRDKNNFRLAEIAYFKKQFKGALEQLSNVMKDIMSNTTNDALTLQIFIMENQEENSGALAEFAKAEFLKRQRKLSEALAIYEDIFKINATTELADETLMSIGDILTQMKRFSEAIAAYERLTKEYSESINLDKATMKIGQIYELGLSDKAKAIEAYQRLLEKHPNSVYVSGVRKKIRELRGDTI